MRFRLGKRVISQYIRSECLRRLRLDLIPDATTRKLENAPPKDSARPGLQLLTKQGRSYERKKFKELAEIFDSRVIHGETAQMRDEEELAFGRIFLRDHIDSLLVGNFLIEPEYTVTRRFKDAHGLNELCESLSAELLFDNVRPDIIHVIAATGRERRIIAEDGAIHNAPPDDTRLGLQIIDIKIAGQPSPAHFSELAYYGMTLAAWLADNGLDAGFAVLADAAIWPGKHDDSAIAKLEMQEKRQRIANRDYERYVSALNSDLIYMPPEVVIGRVKRFLAHDLRQAMSAEDWRCLPWHVDAGCSGCDYLGYRWTLDTESDPREPEVPQHDEEDDVRALYCWPTAEREQHLSRIPGLTEGASGKLREVNVESITQLAALKPGSKAFEGHQVLRARRTVFRDRAIVQQNNDQTRIPEKSGTSAVIPRYPDIKVALSADFDVGSGITFSLGYRIDYATPTAVEGKALKKELGNAHRVMLVETGHVETEAKILEEWLTHLAADIIRIGREVDDGYQRIAWTRQATVQLYIWDKLTFDHLRRVTSRHMERVIAPAQLEGSKVNLVAWLFPAEQVLEDPEFVTQNSPVTILGEAVDSILASPVPHRHTIISIANSIDPDRKTQDGRPWSFRINKFYQDPLSDQIPSERGQEIWNQDAPFLRMDHQEHRDKVRQVVGTKLRAILYIANFLSETLGPTLSASAPSVESIFTFHDRLEKASDDSQVIYQHSLLMAAASRLDAAILMAMPPHEREARFASVRVVDILAGNDRLSVLDRSGLLGRTADAHVLVLRIHERSRDAKMKEGDFNWSFLPEAELPKLQNLTVWQFKVAVPKIQARFPLDGPDRYTPARQKLKAQILKIDRSNRTVVVEISPLLLESMNLGAVQFSLDQAAGRFAILDPFETDYFTKPCLKPALTAIANPDIARTRRLFPSLSITKVQRAKKPRKYPRVPADQFIWEADVMSAAQSRFDKNAIAAAADLELPSATSKQREAIGASASRRLALWWGPPGSGKSATAAALLRGLLSGALATGTGMRIAITGPTWVAIDNVACRLPKIIHDLKADVQLFRLVFASSALSQVHPALRSFTLPTSDVQQLDALADTLSDSSKIVVVASTVEQLSKLGGRKELQKFLDFLLIDEASQMDVAHAIVAFSKLAEGASVTVVGDDKQMQPIHPLDPPEGVEHLLGSIYNFYRNYGVGSAERSSVEPVMLDTSFRSNAEIIEFVREAGYGPSFVASPGSKHLRIGFAKSLELPDEDWPGGLPWCDEFSYILDPEKPLVSIVHDDRFSSQRNDEEAIVVASLVLCLYRRGLQNLELANSRSYDATEFFRQGVGIVTPHRAQQSAVLDKLDEWLPKEVNRDALYAAVDTVERFQGQEKALMIASFGLGDADQIAAEETFLFGLNRFNVIVSRAKAKFIGLLTRRLVDHLPRDPKALEESRLLKSFADGFLRTVRPVESLCGLKNCEVRSR